MAGESEEEDDTPPTIRPIINVFGSFDPDAFTEAVSLEPTSTHRAGDPRTPRTPRLLCRQDGWRVELDKRQTYSLEEEVDRMLAVLDPVRATFRATVESMGLEAEAAFYIDVYSRPYPAVGLRLDQIEQLAELGMSLDVDIM